MKLVFGLCLTFFITEIILTVMVNLIFILSKIILAKDIPISFWKLTVINPLLL